MRWKRWHYGDGFIDYFVPRATVNDYYYSNPNDWHVVRVDCQTGCRLLDAMVYHLYQTRAVDDQ